MEKVLRTPEERARYNEGEQEERHEMLREHWNLFDEMVSDEVCFAFIFFLKKLVIYNVSS